MSRTLADLFSLRGKVALVTGASSGLGVEMARALALAGADLVLVARRRERLEELAAALQREYGVRAAAVAADLARDDELDSVVPTAEQALGPIDILVNNAGIAPTGRAETYSAEKWATSLQLNLTAPFRLSQAVARRMIERQSGGRIINVTSVLDTRANPIYWASGYVASKAGLSNLTHQLATEWARHGITVNALAPGWFLTEMTEGGFAKPEYRQKAETRTALGRLGQPDELQTAILYLAAPASTFVTGSTVYVDGGWSAW